MAKFHQIRGSHVHMNVNRTIGTAKWYGNGTIFSADPLSPGVTFPIKIREAKLPFYKPSLRLGVTETTPKDWDANNKKDPRTMRQTWFLQTWNGTTRTHGRSDSACVSWQNKFGDNHSQSTGDIFLMTLREDRSLSIKYNNTEVKRVFTDLPNNPLWVVIEMFVKQIEIYQSVYLKTPTVTPLENIRVYEGEVVTLNVTVTGEPEPDVEWFLEENKLVRKPETSINKEGNKHTLSMRKLVSSDSGRIAAKASNLVGATTEQAMLFVQEILAAPMVNGLSDKHVHVGDHTKLKAEVIGKPTPEVKWKHAGSVVADGEKYKITTEGDNHMLMITNCEEKDSGEIVIIASNKVRQTTTSMNLTVKKYSVTSKRQGVGTHVFDIAQGFIDDIHLPDGYLYPKYNVCFCETCHLDRGDNLVYLRGLPPKKYGLPIGWCKFGLRAPSRAKVHKIFENWHVAFHGTSVDCVEKILQTGELLIPGDTTPSGDILAIPNTHWDPSNPEMRPPAGHDVNKFYFSPSIKYAGCDVYSPLHKFKYRVSGNTHQIRVAFQVRIQPDTYDVGEQTIGETGAIDQLFPNNLLEWSTDRRGVAILVGLLVKVEDVVGTSPSLGIGSMEIKATEQKGCDDEDTYPAIFRISFTHETERGEEIEIQVGESCLVLHEDGNQLQVLHSMINEPFLIPKNYVRRERS